MLNEAQRKLVADSIEQAKREIMEDIASGRVPFTVSSFGRLHDYVDANCYGGLCEDGSGWDALFPGKYAENGATDGPKHIAVQELFCDAVNQVQDAVDLWLRGMDRCALLVERMCEDALNAACLSIQERVGESDGGLAGILFSGSGKQALFDAISDYVWAELRAKCEEPGRLP